MSTGETQRIRQLVHQYVFQPDHGFVATVKITIEGAEVEFKIASSWPITDGYSANYCTKDGKLWVNAENVKGVVTFGDPYEA